jgi:hypothetical protein
MRRTPPRCEAIAATSGERCKNRPTCKSRWGGRKVCEAHQNSLRFIAVLARAKPMVERAPPVEARKPVYNGNVVPFRPRERTTTQAAPLWRRWADQMDPRDEPA